MNVLVLGESPRATELIEALSASATYRVHHSSQSAAAEGDYGAVILADPSEVLVTEALNLLETGLPLVIVPGPNLGPAMVQRIGLVAEATGTPLVTWLPAVKDTRRIESDQTWGEMTHVQIDRRSGHDHEELLFDDLAILRQLAGRFTQVTAILTQEPGQPATSATITLTRQDHLTADWTLRSSQTDRSRRIVISGTSGDTQQVDNESDSPSHSLDVIEQLTGHVSFEELIDIVETFDAIRESARRRRTIELHFESTSERTVFKSQMSAVGCLLLMLTLLGLIVLLVLGAVLAPGATRSGRAAKVDFLINDAEFENRKVEPLPNGRKHLQAIQRRMSHVDAPLVIEASGDPDLDSARVALIRKWLIENGQAGQVDRVVVEPTLPSWKPIVLQIARVAWLAPLVLFLLLQLLILATRSARTR